jgi:patatin-like phospholipase
MYRLLVIFLLVFGVVGCAQPSSPFKGLSVQEARIVAERMESNRREQLQADLQSAFSVRSPQNILVLSGGDADGAFGCGFLSGWREAEGGRPTFDLVTGVSTGALMSTFAFLGEERDDQSLRELYTKLRDEDVFNGPMTWGAPDSLFDTVPLQELLKRTITHEVIARVGAAHWQGRRLYVATADLDANALVIWPMSKLAAEGTPESEERYRRILLASAAIPMFLPPVRIDGDLQVDAGLREAVFLRDAMLGVAHAYDAAAKSSEPRSKPTVYLIANGKLMSDPSAVSDDVVSIGLRSLDLYQNSLQLFNLREVAHIAAEHDPRFAFKYISIPANVDDKPRGTLTMMFDPETMKRLWSSGRDVGRHAETAWTNGPPPVDSDPGAVSAGADAILPRER